MIIGVSRAVEESNRRLLRARDAMDRRYAEPLDVPTLARIAHVSEAHFIRTFRATFGETPNRYLQRRRVERAMFLLRSADRTSPTSAWTSGSRRWARSAGCSATSWGSRRASTGARGPLPPVPSLLRDGVAATEQFRRSTGGVSAPSVRAMLNALTITQIYVPDQDQALDFYVGKLGFEVTNDMQFGPMRWLTVALPGQPDRAILLEKPGPPSMSEETAAQVRELIAKGAAGGHLFFRTATTPTRPTPSSRRRAWRSPRSRSTSRYGIDFGLRDPFGNHLRIAQMKQA